MSGFYISSFCEGFRDYDALRELVEGCREVGAGVELGTSWDYPGFDELLEKQADRFCDVPVTLHAPFVEICGAAGSPERAYMERQFRKAFRWYHLFGASSMVMHTHERAVPPGQLRRLQRQAVEGVLAAAEWAAEEGVHLTVENVGFPAKKNVLFDREQYIRLFDVLPETVGALIDTGHAMANGWDIPDVVERLGTRIEGFHLHNTDGLHDLHRPIYEEGLYYTPQEMDELLRCVGKHCGGADLILEYVSGEHITAQRLCADMKRARKCLEDAIK